MYLLQFPFFLCELCFSCSPLGLFLVSLKKGERESEVDGRAVDFLTPVAAFVDLKRNLSAYGSDLREVWPTFVCTFGARPNLVLSFVRSFAWCPAWNFFVFHCHQLADILFYFPFLRDGGSHARRSAQIRRARWLHDQL